MEGEIPISMRPILTNCGCKGEPDKICGYCIRESQRKAKERKTNRRKKNGK